MRKVKKMVDGGRKRQKVVRGGKKDEEGEKATEGGRGRQEELISKEGQDGLIGMIGPRSCPTVNHKHTRGRMSTVCLHGTPPLVNQVDVL